MVEKNEAGLYEATVDGRVYEWEQWGAEEAMDTLIDIVAILGKPIARFGGRAFSKGVAEALKLEVGEDAIQTVVENLVDNLTTQRALVMRLVKRLAAGKKMFCNGKTVDFDAHYRGDLAHLWRVAQVALEVQYGNFFDAASELVGVRRAAAKTLATPQK